MIRPARVQDLANIMSLTNDCAEHMISMGIFQWNEHYPPLSTFEKDLERKELYVLEKANSLIGCIVLSTIKDEEYRPIDWLSVTENNLYIHRLAIHPGFQGQGLARQLMDFAEDYAREQQFESIRLDTFSQNKRNQKFYESRGYERLSEIYFPKQSTHPFYCYELLL